MMANVFKPLAAQVHQPGGFALVQSAGKNLPNDGAQGKPASQGTVLAVFTAALSLPHVPRPN
jgi:hypothetical protein